MTETHNNPRKILDLRQRAENKLASQNSDLNDSSLDEIKRLLHELSVHQVELELQNEELRSTQAELEVSRRKYIDLYEISPVGLFLLNQSGIIQDPNMTFASIIGISRHKFGTRDFSSLITPESQESYHFFFQRLRNTQQPQQCEVTLLAANHTQIPVRIDGIALMQADQSPSYRIAVTDLTVQRQAEADRLELVAERQRIKVLSDFVRDLSEDLRTPITAMIMDLYVAGKSVHDQTYLGKIEAVTKHLFHLNTVLDQLQQMAVLDNLMMLELKPEDLNRLVEEVVLTFKVQAVAKKVKLVLELQESLPAIPMDVNAMDRALRNVIENALRFTDKGGRITIRTCLEDNHAMIEVQDNGSGIDAETLPHIFKRFFKGKVAYQQAPGAGLGLPLARQILALHHGSIDISSTPGVHTTCTFKLPVH